MGCWRHLLPMGPACLLVADGLPPSNDDRGHMMCIILSLDSVCPGDQTHAGVAGVKTSRQSLLAHQCIVEAMDWAC